MDKGAAAVALVAVGFGIGASVATRRVGASRSRLDRASPPEVRLTVVRVPGRGRSTTLTLTARLAEASE